VFLNCYGKLLVVVVEFRSSPDEDANDRDEIKVGRAGRVGAELE
jgi:hypothetical protein